MSKNMHIKDLTLTDEEIINLQWVEGYLYTFEREDMDVRAFLLASIIKKIGLAALVTALNEEAKR